MNINSQIAKSQIVKSQITKRLATAAIGALAATTAFTGVTQLAGPPAAQAVPGVPAAAFDPNETGWYSFRDQSSAAFASTFAEKAEAGYILTDLEIDTPGSAYRVGSVWQKNLDGRAWKEKRDLTSAQFHDEWEAAKKDRMRLVEQETYVTAGERLYAGVWVQNTEGMSWASHRGQTNAQFKASFAAHRDDGLMPVDFDQYSTAKGLRYDTVWVDTPPRTGWKLYRNLSSAGFSAKFAANPSYRMLSFESLDVGGTQKYGGIWVSNTNGRGALMRRDLTKKSYGNYWHRYADLGYRVVGFDRYQTAAGTRYAGIWRQNTDRPTWTLKEQVNDRISDELATGVPGISVAIFQDGTPTYLRGFGNADVDNGIWMDSDHVGSLASVSKAVGGVLTLRMAEQGLVDLDDETRDLVPTMPAHHTHTVGDLLANRGCVRHYVSGQDGFANEEYATALEASEEFWDDDLICDPADEEYHYSTHGYTLLGAALEAAGGNDIQDLVRTKLTTPFKLGTLGPQNFSAGVHRMEIYSGDNGADDAVDTPNNDWKVLGGGIDSSVADLGSFGAKLIGGSILSQDSLDTMFTAPDASNSYAYGWKTGSEDGTPVVAKDGSWTGNLAYLRLYPEEGIVVAVMMNSRSGDQSAAQLGKDLGSLVLDSVQ